MSQILNVLIVEDHPFIINAYRNAFKEVTRQTSNIRFDINTACDCDSAEIKIKEAKKGLPLDLVLLDISLPPSSNGKLLSGDDLGLMINETFRHVKLIVLTSHDDNHKLCDIFKILNPEGFLIKSDFSFQDLVRAITDVIQGSPYYSKTVTRLIRSHMSSQITLDKKDREILYYLSQGAKMKELPEVIHLSLAGIERRKRRLREVFGIEKKDDRALIESAKEKGFV